GDIKEVLVRSAREADRQALADTRMGTVTAGNESCLAGLEACVRTPEVRDYVAAALLEADEFRLPLDRCPGIAQPVDQQPFVLVLRKDERIRVRADARAHVAEHRVRDLATRDPEVRCGHF